MSLNWIIELDKKSFKNYDFNFEDNKYIWQTKWWAKTLLKSEMAEKIFVIPHYNSIIRSKKFIIVEKRSVWFWDFWLFVLGLDCDFNDYEYKLIELCKKEKAMFIQVETLDYHENVYVDTTRMKFWAYKKFIQPFTAVIDLNRPEDEILKMMKQKGRYNIKLAHKKWISVQKMDSKNEDNLNIFYNLLEETTSRNSFSQNKKKYFKKFLHNIAGASLWFAYYESEVISAWIFVESDETFFYYYWASTSNMKFRKLMAPYLLQWEVIKYAKEKWCKIYDFLWVSKPWDNKSDLAWVTDFKMKLTPDIRWVSVSYIFVNKKIKYTAISLLKKILFFRK